MMKKSIFAIVLTGALFTSVNSYADIDDALDLREQHQAALRLQERGPQERNQSKMLDGPAPAFTLEGLDGKPVSLDDFKGKWVVLDFWGTWCSWCIKGFPEMIKTYEKYKDEDLVFISIDCRDSKAAWKAGVEKYKLPWVNVYVPEDNTEILKQYNVSAFPLKVIIDDEGDIFDIVVGEDKIFYDLIDAIFKE